PPRSTPFPYTTPFRSGRDHEAQRHAAPVAEEDPRRAREVAAQEAGAGSGHREQDHGQRGLAGEQSDGGGSGRRDGADAGRSAVQDRKSTRLTPVTRSY